MLSASRLLHLILLTTLLPYATSMVRRRRGAEVPPAAGLRPAKPLLVMRRLRGGGLRVSTTQTALKNGCASGLAAACAKTALQPFDSIKTVQQQSTVPLSMGAASQQLLERAGVGALYSGLLVAIVGAMPSVFVYFSVYQFLKERLQAAWAAEGALAGKCAAVLTAAGLGNFVASFLRPPYEILKQRLQAGTDATLVDAVRRIHRELGPGGFWQGLSAQMARDIPYAMATLLVYELLQAALLARKARAGAGGGTAAAAADKPQSKLPKVENAVIGALAGGFGSFVTNPMDVVKTRMMVKGNTAMGWSATVMSIADQEGGMAFWKGCAPRLLQKMPANAIFFLCYEFFRVVLGVERDTTTKNKEEEGR